MLALKRQNTIERYCGLLAANLTAGAIGPLQPRWLNVRVGEPSTSACLSAVYGQELPPAIIGTFATANTSPAQAGLHTADTSTAPSLQLAETEGWDFVSYYPAANVRIIGTEPLTCNVGFMALTFGTVGIPASVARAVTFSAEIGAAGLGWLVDQDSLAEVSIPQLSALYSRIHEWLKQQSFPIVDELLKSTNPARVPVAAGVALLRYSFLARAELPHWESFLSRVKADLKSRNLDSKRLLIGLSGA